MTNTAVNSPESAPDPIEAVFRKPIKDPTPVTDTATVPNTLGLRPVLEQLGLPEPVTARDMTATGRKLGTVARLSFIHVQNFLTAVVITACSNDRNVLTEMIHAAGWDDAVAAAVCAQVAAGDVFLHTTRKDHRACKQSLLCEDILDEFSGLISAFATKPADYPLKRVLILLMYALESAHHEFLNDTSRKYDRIGLQRGIELAVILTAGEEAPFDDVMARLGNLCQNTGDGAAEAKEVWDLICGGFDTIERQRFGFLINITLGLLRYVDNVKTVQKAVISKFPGSTVNELREHFSSLNPIGDLNEYYIISGERPERYDPGVYPLITQEFHYTAWKQTEAVFVQKVAAALMTLQSRHQRYAEAFAVFHQMMVVLAGLPDRLLIKLELAYTKERSIVGPRSGNMFEIVAQFTAPIARAMHAGGGGDPDGDLIPDEMRTHLASVLEGWTDDEETEDIADPAADPADSSEPAAEQSE